MPVKRSLTMGMLILLLLGTFTCASGEIRGYEKGRGYDYVTLGAYPYEADGTEKPVLWRVLSAKDGQALLLTEYIIDTKQIIFETNAKVIEKHTFRRISAYSESDLYAWLNTEGLDTLMGDDPLRNALMEEPDLGKLFPLPQEEYMNVDNGFEHGQWGEEINAYPRRQGTCTPYAAAQGLYTDYRNQKSPYWCVAIKDKTDYKFGLVGYNGHISWGAYTNTKVGGLRLAVRLDLSVLTIASGTGIKDDPYVLRFTGAEPTAEPATPKPEQAAEPEPETTAEPLPEATAMLTETPEEKREKSGVTLSLIGDCSIGDSIQFRGSETSYDTTIRKNGYGWPFSLVRDYLLSDDLTIANLEVVLTNRQKHTDKLYNLSADPAHVQALVEGGVDIVNTVNNHCMDFMEGGYLDTLRTLDQAGIRYFGTIYPGSEEGHDDLGVMEAGGIRFGFVGFSYPQDADVKRIASRIQRLKEEGCDIVIVSLHWGRETYMTPEPWQFTYAKQVIDAGADVIYGHHPHVIQPIQFYQGKPIFYSTGNFTFGTMSKVDPSTGIFQLTYERIDGQVQLQELRVIPCETQGNPDYRPFELTDQADRQAVFSELVLKKEYKNCQNPPASFLESGIIRFENGQMLP